MRGLHRIYCLGFALQSWFRSRLTPAGWTVIACLCVMPFMRLQSEFSVGYQMFLFLLSTLCVSALWAASFKGRFLADRSLPRFASVGQAFHYTVELRNLSPKTQDGLWVRESQKRVPMSLAAFTASALHQRRHRSFRFEKTPASPLLLPLEPQPLQPLSQNLSASVTLQLTPTRRGSLRFDGIEFLRPDPLGLVQGRIVAKSEHTLLVLPRRYPIPPLPLPGTARYQVGGVAQSSSIGESEEFVSLRDYRRGDSPRQIHWKSWAKTGKLIVRENEDEFFVRHALILDTFPSPPALDRFEEAVSIAASFACSLDTQESLLDLMFVGTKAFCFTMGRGLGYPQQALEILAGITPAYECDPPQSIQSLIAAVNQQSQSLSGCIVVLVEWDPPRQTWIESLANRGIPLLVIVITESDAPRPEPGSVLRSLDVPFLTLRAGSIPQGLASLNSPLTGAQTPD